MINLFPLLLLLCGGLFAAAAAAAAATYQLGVIDTNANLRRDGVHKLHTRFRKRSLQSNTNGALETRDCVLRAGYACMALASR